MLATSGDLKNKGKPCTRIDSPEGNRYVFDCKSITALDQFLMSENPNGMSSDQIRFCQDFVAYENGELIADDMAALDTLLTQMIITGNDCVTLQGALYAN